MIRNVAFITGAGSGIGAGFARSLAASGVRVLVSDLRPAAAVAVAEAIRAAGGVAQARALDVTDATAVQAAVAETIAAWGQIDYLFANAGALGPSNFEAITPQDWDQVLDVNVKGVALTCQSVIPHMRARRSGRILITASYNGVRVGSHVIPYRVSKAAALMYMRCLAVMLAPDQVTVNAICPGVTRTPMQDSYARQAAAAQGITLEAYFDERAARIPMGALTTFDDLNALAHFLISDDARLITGQAIAVDGGVMASS